MKKRVIQILITLLLLKAASPVWAQEDSPVTQCGLGVKLFLGNNHLKALPLLEAGFAGRDEAKFSTPYDLGACALALGISRHEIGDGQEALEALGVAERIFAQTGERRLEGITLGAIGLVYSDQNRYEEALASFEEALAIVQEVGSRPDEVAAYNNIASVYKSQSRYEEALVTYEVALAVAREMGDRPTEGRILNGIGLVYRLQSRYEEALASFEEALAIVQEVGDRNGKGDILSNIGVVFSLQSRYKEALAAFEVALAIAQEVGNRSGEGVTLGGIASVYESQGRYEEALVTYEVSLAIAREVGDRNGEGASLNNIGRIYHQSGRYEEALAALEQALVITREVGNRSGEGATLGGIALVYESQGRYEEALDTNETALAIAREVGDRNGEGITLNNIGVIYYEWGRYAEAVATFEQALVILREVDSRPDEVAAYNNIGLVYQAQSRQEDALASYEAALTIAREVRYRPIESTILNNIASVYESQGRYEEALSTFEEALEICREVGDRPNEGVILAHIGQLYLLQDRYEEALATIQEAIGVLEFIRSISGNDIARSSYIAQHSQVYDIALDVALRQAKLADAFHFTEQGRARSFNDVMTTGYVQLSSKDTTGLISAEQVAYNEIIAIKDAIAHARALNPSDPELVGDLEARLATAETAHEETLKAIEAKGKQLAELVPGRQSVLSLSEVQSYLGLQTTLVSFWVLDERAIAFILTHDSFSVESIDVTAERLAAQVMAFHDFSEIESNYPAASTTLYHTLIEPIYNYLKTPHLIIVPHQVLHYVPFSALSDGESYLMDNHVITYLPNASMLQFLPRNEGSPSYDAALIVGNPTTIASDDFGTPLPPLPYAEASAESIADMFGTTSLLAEGATETSLRQNVHETSVLHIGAHAFFNTAAPLQSAIYLTPGNDDTDMANDGKLLTQEVYSLPMEHMELVVLSACQTNLGYLERDIDAITNISAGDELVSLNRAFLFHSPTVISTLWTVDDAATGLLMERFYSYLLDGSSKADALRLAQLDTRMNYPNPYYWAGFILSGDGGVVMNKLLLPTDDPLHEPTQAALVTRESSEPIIFPEQRPVPNRALLILLALPLLLIGGMLARWWWKRR